MQEIHVTRNTVCENSSSVIPQFKMDTLTEQGINATLYYLHTGSALTISHDLITFADGTTMTDFDPAETIVHFCAKGRIRYVFPDHVETLGLFDSITFHSLMDDVVVEILEDTVLLITSTPEATMDGEKDVVLDELMREISNRDNYTRRHCNHVAVYAAKIAVQMKLLGRLESLGRAASLHDIGKVKIPDSVLLKPDRLTDEEFAIIKHHPELGYNILRDHISNDEILQAVLQHHERLDGSGYPRGLKGDEIGLDARILMTADVFDALTTNRVYRKSFDCEKALAIMQQDADHGKMDPTMLDALREGIASGQINVIEDEISQKTK